MAMLAVSVESQAAEPRASSTTPTVCRFEHVLGTSAELQLRGVDEATVSAVEREILEEIQRLALIYSRYDAQSELRRWCARPGEPVALSAELSELLRLAERWIERSQGAFHPAIGEVSRVWREAEASQQLPTAAALSAACQICRDVPWRRDDDGRYTLTQRVALDFDAIAKGVIIDRALARAAQAFPQVDGMLLNIGGDLRAIGSAEFSVAIADPLRAAENAPPLTRIRVREQAVATSGNYRRGFDVASRHRSHILDPRTGQPADQLASVTVVAPDAATADVLATILSVLPSDEGLKLAGQQRDTACLLIGADGRQYASAQWHRYAPPESNQDRVLAKAEPDAAAGDAWPAGQEMVIDLELNRPGGGGYRRPYVAVWVEDEKGFPVRTISLWLQKQMPGPRWHRDLRRWYRNDQMRLLVDETDLIETQSSATRAAGKYQLIWDGRDDAKQPLPAGKYTLYIEAAREHGTYQLLQHDFELDAKPFAKTLTGNVEIKAVTIGFRPHEQGQRADRSKPSAK